MKRKIASGIMLTLLLMAILVLAYNIQPLEAEPRTWNADDEPTRFVGSESLEQWTNKTSMPTPRYNFAVAEVNEKIYCIGGESGLHYTYNLNEVYDPTTDSWATKNPMPYGCYGCAAGVVNGRIYVIGGQNSSSQYGTMRTVQEYDPVTDSWTIKAPMPTKRYKFAIGVVNNKIYAFGGYQWGLMRMLDTVEEYDPSTNSWNAKTPMPTARYQLAAGVFNSKIYVIGGGAGTVVEALDVNEAYDPTTDSWSTKTPLPTPRYGLAVSVANQKIYAFGGYNQYEGLLDANEEYDPISDTWIPRLSMPTARMGHGTATVCEKVYAIGGYFLTGVNEEYTPPLGSNDLTIVSVKPVQVVIDANALVMDKKTVLRVKVFSTYSSTQNVNMNITYNFECNYTIDEDPDDMGIPTKPGLNTVYLPGGPVFYEDGSEQSYWKPLYNEPWPKVNYLYWNQTGIDNNINVKILLDDANPDNNEMTTSKDVVESKSLRIRVVPVYFPTIGQLPFTPSERRINASMQFLLDTYPLGEDSLSWEPTAPVACLESPPVMFPGVVLDLWLYTKVAMPISLSAQLLGYDRAVIVMRDIGQGWGGNAIGWILDPVPVFAVHERLVLDESQGHYHLFAHEIGHTYLLWHPHDIGPPVYEAEKYWVAQREFEEPSRTFMSYQSQNPSWIDLYDWEQLPLWIDEGRYDSNPPELREYEFLGRKVPVPSWNLFDQLTIEGMSLAQSSEDAVLIRGMIYKNNTARADEAWYRFTAETFDLQPGGAGNYSVVLVDSEEQILSEVPFNATFHYMTEENGTTVIEETDFMPFLFRIPYESGTSTIQIRNVTGHVLISRTVSSNMPIVGLTSPNGGEIFEAGLNYTVTWDASDIDGDTLSHTLAYSPDEGVNWAPVATDIEGDSYVWNTSHLQKGSEYLIKVITTDGINTVEDISDGAFTVKVHDVAATQVRSSKIIVGRGYNATINVTIANSGDFDETFSVTAYANETVIGTEEITLSIGSNITIPFEWDTTGISYGNYTISASAAPVELEFFTEDNNYTNGMVQVTIPGDVNGDGFVDVFDLSIVGQSYGCFHWMPCYNPEANITEDGLVDARDLALVTLHYGESNS